MGLTRQQLAQIVGCSLSMLQLLEQGFRPSRSRVLPRVEAVLAERSVFTATPHGHHHDDLILHKGVEPARDGLGPQPEAAHDGRPAA